MGMATVSIPSQSRRWQTGTRIAVALALALAVLGITAIRSNLAFVLARTSPDLAIRLDPKNAEAASAEAENLLRAHKDRTTRLRAEELAKQALARDPTAASAVRILAIAAAIDGRESDARRFLALSESLSRRDIQTQLMLIEDAVQHNRVDEAVHHYDIALRTSREIRGLLFPVLVQATSQPEVARVLTATLTAKPDWSDAFVDVISRSASDIGSAAAFLAASAQAGAHLPPPAVAILVGRLVDHKQFGAAWRLYLASYPARHQALRDRYFAQANQIVSPTWFDWVLYPIEGHAPQVIELPAGTRLRVEAPNGAAGNVARQLLMLVPGRYRIDAQLFNRATDSGAVTIGLTCATNGKVLGVMALPSADVAGRTMSFNTAVPTDCEAQWLDINADGQDAIAGAKADIGSLSVQRLR